MAKRATSHPRLTRHERTILAQREEYLRGRSTSDQEKMLPMYTPERAARLAAQSRLLWAELKQLVDQLLQNLHSGARSQEEAGFWARTIQIMIHGYSPEQREWRDARLWATPGGDRDEEHGLFRFMNELDNIVGSRLQQLEEAVGECDPDDLEFEFGQEFAKTLETLMVVWDDWQEVFGIFEQIDAGPNSKKHIGKHLSGWDKELAAIERRTAARQRRTTVPPRKPATFPSKPPKRRQ
jgi:hypothetical protein